MNTAHPPDGARFAATSVRMDGSHPCLAFVTTISSTSSARLTTVPTAAFLGPATGNTEVVSAFEAGGERLLLACRDNTRLWGYYHSFVVCALPIHTPL